MLIWCFYTPAERQWSDPQCQIRLWQWNQSWRLGRVFTALWRHPHCWVLRCHRGKHRLCELCGQSWGNRTGACNTEGKERKTKRGYRWYPRSHLTNYLCLFFCGFFSLSIRKPSHLPWLNMTQRRENQWETPEAYVWKCQQVITVKTAYQPLIYA